LSSVDINPAPEMDFVASKKAENRRTVFPPLDIKLFRDEEPTESSPHNTRPVVEKVSSALTAQRKKVQNQSQPIELNLRFERQKSDKSPRGPIIYDDPWEIYQKLVYQNDTGDAQKDENGDAVGAYSLQNPETPKMVLRISPALDSEWLQTILRINHEHIVPVHEAFVHKGDSFLVYEMMHVSLKQLLTGNLQLRESQVAKICQEVNSCPSQRAVKC
jgi:hypothetical protein